MRRKLESLKVLWCQPITLGLWGIPYDMRPGQSPADLWRSHHNWKPARPGWYGSKQISLSDWVCLGWPGWWGSIPKDEIEAIKTFLETHRNDIPQNPAEYT